MYKRPLAAFYLEEPPPDSTAIRDLRRLPDRVPRAFSPELRLLIRSARERQRWLREILPEIGHPAVDSVGSATLAADSEGLAQRARALLGIREQEQQRWRDRWQALREWIEAIEDAGVFVFQSGAVEVSEMRGFALPDTLAPLITVNAKDALSGRIFTALHEFVHILLGEEGISNLVLPDHPGGQADRIEAYCNAVAAETLVPGSWLRTAVDEQRIRSDLDGAIQYLCDLFKVSREVIARRLLHLDYIGRQTYEAKRRQYQQELEQAQREREESRTTEEAFWLSPARRAIRDNGRAFARAALAAYNQELITPSELSRLLGAKLKHLTKIEEAAFSISRTRGRA